MLKNLVRTGVVHWEKFICKVKKIQPISDSRYGLLCIRTIKYKGQTIKFADNHFLNKGDFIIELHISNVVLAKGAVGDATVASDLQIFPYIREDLFLLGKYLRSQCPHTKIKAIGGVTIHGPGIRRFGFTLYPGQKSLSNTLASIWMKLLRWGFSHPKEIVRIRKHHPRHLEYFYMPITQFLDKYGVSAVLKHE